MASNHHDFVFQLRIHARNLRDRVETVLVIAGKLSLYVHLNRDWHVGLEQPVDAAIVLDRRDHDRQRFGLVTLVGEPSHSRSAIIKDRSASSAIVPSIADLAERSLMMADREWDGSPT